MKKSKLVISPGVDEEEQAGHSPGVDEEEQAGHSPGVDEEKQAGHPQKEEEHHSGLDGFPAVEHKHILFIIHLIVSTIYVCAGILNFYGKVWHKVLDWQWPPR